MGPCNGHTTFVGSPETHQSTVLLYTKLAGPVCSDAGARYRISFDRPTGGQERSAQLISERLLMSGELPFCEAASTDAS